MEQELKLANNDKLMIETAEGASGSITITTYVRNEANEAAIAAMKKGFVQEGIVVDSAVQFPYTGQKVLQALEFAPLAAAPAGMNLVKEIPVGGGYDDSWQWSLVPVDKRGPFGIVYRTWKLVATKALRHQLMLRLYLPPESELWNAFLKCLATAAVVAAIVAVASGPAAVPAFKEALAYCLGREALAKCVIKLDDDSHWVDL